MDLTKKLLQFLSLLSLFISTVYSQSVTHPVSGKWEGKLLLPQTSLRIFFEIKQTDGKFRARMASPDQSPSYIPVENINWRNDSLILEVRRVNGVYSAKLSKDGMHLEGIWRQGPGAIPLTVKKTDALEFYPKRPQEPEKPYPYQEHELVYENKNANISLGATLTVPKGKGPFPAAILITGSGSQNRNEEIMGHKPFLVIADYLTRRGIAVLRVDDRGVGKSTGEAAATTSEDNASDVITSLEYLRSRKEIDSKRIGLIGHSEGGMIAPMVISQNSDVAFAVLLAGVGLPGDVLYKKQLEKMLRLSSSSNDEIRTVLAVIEKFYDVIKADKYVPTIKADFREILEAETPAIQAKLKNHAEAMSRPWFRYFINFDPATYLQKVQCPILAMNGSKDIQVDSKENLAAIEKAVKTGGNRNVTVREIPNLNHLFQTAGTGGLEEYTKLEETFAPVALKMMGDWILGVIKN